MSESDISKAAKTLSKLGASKGGKVRSQTLTPERKHEIATTAADARWQVPKADHVGKIVIGDMEFPCSVLSDETRILTQSDFMSGMGMYYSGWVANSMAKKESSADIPHFLAFKSLEPFIHKHLGDLQSIIVKYRTTRGTIAHGIKAEIIPKICEVWLDADEHGKLRTRQKRIAEKAKIIIRALAHTGIIALVDEATGYQEVRDRDALHKILAAYISPELLPYAQRFPPEFYKQICRLHRWTWNPFNPAGGPRLIGKITNQLVYDKLPEGVLDELRKKNPVVNNGRRKHKHFQFLTQHIGNEHLERQVASVTTLMRISPDKRVFDILFDKAFPTTNTQIEMMTSDEEEKLWESIEERSE